MGLEQSYYKKWLLNLLMSKFKNLCQQVRENMTTKLVPFYEVTAVHYGTVSDNCHLYLLELFWLLVRNFREDSSSNAKKSSRNAKALTHC